MLIKKNRLFTYPVLAEFTGHYKSGKLDAEFKDISSDDYYIFICTCIISDNSDLEALVSDGRCDYTCLVECSRTKYRQLFKSKTKDIEIKILKSELSGRTEFSVNLIATEEIKGFYSALLTEEFARRKFDFEPGSFLAVGPQRYKKFPVLIDEDYRSDNSLIDIRKSMKKFPAMSVSWDEKKIIVYLYDETFKLYASMKKNKALLEILAQSVAVPALQDILNTVVNDKVPNADLDPKTTQWYEKLDALCIKLGYSDGLEDACSRLSSKLPLAQQILKNPLQGALLSIENLMCTDKEDDHNE